jgi:hypothetical protein
MLKRYTANSVAENGDTTFVLGEDTLQMKTLLAVPAGQEAAVVTIDIQNGASAADVAVTVARSGAVVSKMLFTLAANDFITIDSKEFLQAGDILAFGASAAGVNCSVSCDLSEAE